MDLSSFKRRRRARRPMATELLETRQVLAAAPIIAEFMASNDDGIRDGFDRSSDWIEVRNAGDEAINLAGWHLTDDADNLQKWTFPSVELAAQQRLLVFASGCVVTGIECPDPTDELHANFSLRAAGGYLALVKPDGETLASQFGSANSDYPRQYEDVSYGIQESAGDILLVQPGATAELHFPTIDSFAPDWASPSIEPPAADWSEAALGVGYSTTAATPLRIDLNDRTRADETGDSEDGFNSLNLDSNGATFDGVTMTLTAIGGARLDDRDRRTPEDSAPEFTYDQIYDDFIFASGTENGAGMEISLEGLVPNQVYDITIWSYDPSSTGSRISDWSEVLGNQPIETSYSFDGSSLPDSNFANTMSASLTSSADGKLLIRGERNGGTSHGVFLNAIDLRVPGIQDRVTTDVATQMQGQSTGALVRIPFEVAAGTEFEDLSLEVQYDDGFVAYLNGTEVGRRNAPGSAGVPLPGNATATASRDDDQVSVSETIDLTNHLNLVQAGERNVLAFHALNRSIDDADFLLSPTLKGTERLSSAVRYFAEPTPNASNGSGFVGVVGDTTFSVDRGFYDAPFELQITSSTPGATLIYTIDGSLPSLTNGQQVSSAAFDTPVASVPISTTTYVRAMAVKDRMLATNVDTQTYIFLDDVVRQDPLSDPNAPDYPTRWQANATADFEMDPEVVAQWDDNNPENTDVGIREALTSIPTMSIVMNHNDLWGTRGIYNNSDLRGEAYRRAGSIEFFDPNTGEAFQETVGVQIHGGASRDNVRLKKHSFRLLFREDFGAPDRLTYPLFDTDIDGINTLVMRACFTDAFATRTATDRYSPLDSQYTRDVWVKDTLAAMGQPSTNNTYVHLYINGLYWGLYNPAERPDDAFLASYLGGEREDWDVIKDFNELFRGNRNAWSEMFEIAEQMPSSADPDRLFHQLRGNNPDGTPNPDLPNLLDMDNLIDYMILHQYGGAEDWPHHNWYAARNRVNPGEGFQFFVWDQEIVLDGRFRDLTNTGTAGDHRFTPAGLYNKLISSPEFRLLYADRIHKHFSEGGALSNAEAQARWMARSDEVEKAILAESARWGDAREGEQIRVDSGQPTVTVPTITIDMWRAERDNVRDNYIPQIFENYLQHFADADLLPPVEAPEFDRPAGATPAGIALGIQSTSVPFFIDSAILPEFSPVTAHVPTDARLDAIEGTGPAWTQPSFDDSSWLQGNGGVGFERSSGYEELLGIDLLDANLPAGQGLDQDGDGAADLASFYTRFEFEVTADDNLDEVERMLLNMRYDDGFVAYLNGTEIASAGRPDQPAWDSTSLRSHEARGVDEFDVSDFIEQLIVGTNVLAVHGMNRTIGSNDLVISPELVFGRLAPATFAEVFITTDGSDPRLANGLPSPTAIHLEDSFQIDETALIKARGRLEGVWSPLAESQYIVNPNGLDGLRLTEINYNPFDATVAERTVLPGVDNDEFEFLELYNADSLPISLLGAQFTDGVELQFGDETLAPGERAVIVSNTLAFQTRYGTDIRVLGEYGAQLANGGERLELIDVDGEPVWSVSYDDRGAWDERADGIGATLELIAADDVPLERQAESIEWSGSTEYGGSPGAPGSGPIGVSINEVLSNPDPNSQQTDSIELRNRTTNAIDIGGWFLSDSSDNLFKFQIPLGTVLPPGEFIFFDEASFNPTPDAPGANDFGLSSRGDDVWLIVASAAPETGAVAAFVDEAHFADAALGESLGPDADGNWLPLRTHTPGRVNSLPRVGPVVIQEIQYSPGLPSDAALAVAPDLQPVDLEYLEIRNAGDATIDLANWRLRGGIEADLPSRLLGPDEVAVIVSFDSALPEHAERLSGFRAHYQLGESVQLAGSYSGQLNNAGDRIVLQRIEPTADGEPQLFPIEDLVVYNDVAPWPAADANGHSLHRERLDRAGTEATSWTAASPSPASVDRVSADFNEDGATDILDLDLLVAAIRANNQPIDPQLDLDQDDTVSRSDLGFLVTQVLGTAFGDVNLDGRFDSSDLVIVMTTGEFEDSIAGNSTWVDGDWNADGEFTTADLVVAFQDGGYES